MAEGGERSAGGATVPGGWGAATTTFLFTDIEGSTQLLRRAGAAYTELLDEHRRLLRQAFAANDGREIGTEGDSFFVVFPTPSQGVAAAVAGQRALAAHPWPPDRAIRVRMGLHTGEATLVGGDLVGLEVHRAARIAATGHGGQIVASDALVALLGGDLPAGVAVRDLGRYWLKDFARPERLHQLDVDGLPGRFPPVRARPATPDVPAPPTAFVGRVQELAELRDLVRRERLVTLTGPGGIGKTRLALQLVAEAVEERPDGAVFVSLAALTDPELVPTTVARALDVREDGCEDALDALRTRLADADLLLALDNFEQVLGATPCVTALLDAAPGLRVLVTSREALRVRAEHEYPVAPLDLDDGVQLFAQRAAAVRHDFDLDGPTTTAVRRIVRTLDGVPLAIELAASRARVLPPDAILHRLDHSLDFLTDGARDLPERQRALRTTLDWSYDLLDDHDRRLFACLGVFAGSFSLEAVEAVCPGGGGQDLLSGLASLVDKSLLRAEPSGDEARFRMLSMVRDHAREKLAGAGQAEDVGRRYAEHYRDLCLVLQRALRGPEQARWVARLGGGRGSGDADNIRATLRWYLDHGERDEVARIVWSTWLLGWITGRLEECRWWARTALSMDGELSDRSRARLLAVAGFMEMYGGDHAGSVEALAGAVAVGRDLGDEELLANSLLGLSLATAFTGDIATGRAYAEEAAGLFRSLDDRWGRATAASVLTWVAVGEEDFERSGSTFDEARRIAEEPADDLNRAMIETNVAEQRIHAGDLAGAGELLASSLGRYRTLAAFYPSSYALDATARLAAATGRPSLAVVLLGGAARVREGIGVPAEGFHPSRRRALTDSLRAELGDAAFGDAVTRGRALPYDDLVDAALTTATPLPTA